MDVIFDAVAAENLLEQMNNYCSGIQKETRDVLLVLNDSVEWQDNQAKAFESNIKAIAHDLNQALSLESDYMNTFYKRIQELRR